MNPSNPDFSNRTASSPALFNRCVIDWFGDWTDEGLWQVGKEFTKDLDLINEAFTNIDKNMGGDEDPKHAAIVNSIVAFHRTVKDLNQKLAKNAKKYNFITP
jgi:dynein heavy chain 1